MGIGGIDMRHRFSAPMAVASLVLGAVASAVIGVQHAAANGAAEPVCFSVQVFDDSGPVTTLTRGTDDYVIGLFLLEAEDADDCDESEFIADIAGFSGFQLDLLKLPDSGSPSPAKWSSIDGSLQPDTTVDVIFGDGVGDVIEWSIEEEAFQIFTRSTSFPELRSFANELDLVGTVDGRYAAFVLSISADAELGRYDLMARVRNPADKDFLSTVLYQFTVVSAPSNPPAPRPTELACDVVPTVGATVTCTVRADANIEILWSASTNPVFADGVVTTDAAGIGTFSFLVPAGALGQQVLVEVVGWLAPQAIGTAGGPVPRSIPAGDAPDSRAAFLLLLAGLAAVAPRALREAHFTVNR
jgi:hypothetical protein